ncbi:MAG: hypothetical protein ACJ8J0_03225 [Longimicrobiaceae bacterium]|jgi:hypothetical protein
MNKMRLELDRLEVESFEAGLDGSGAGTVLAREEDGCSIQPTCGNPSRGEEGYEELPLTRYACCV